MTRDATNVVTPQAPIGSGFGPATTARSPEKARKTLASVKGVEVETLDLMKSSTKVFEFSRSTRAAL